MLINKDISKNDKIILNRLGKDAETPISELLQHAKYRRKSSVYNRIRNLREEGYLYGPFFNIDYNAIGANKLYSVFVFAEYNHPYKDEVLEAMKTINCWIMIYPVRTVGSYLGVYRCNNWNYIASLFNLMKKWKWLKDFSIHKSEHRWIKQNPDFFGGFLPPPNYQIPEGEFPAYHFDDVEAGFEFSKIDLIVLKYLSTKTCQLTKIRDLEYYFYGVKLKYHDLKRSYENLKETRILLGKEYLMFPLPANICSLFFLITRKKNFKSHLNMITHFGEGLRLTRTLVVVGREVISYFSAHSLLEGKILGILEDNEIRANIYGIKTYPSTEFSVQSFNDDHFDIENQRWVFPYSTFREKLEELKEKKENND